MEPEENPMICHQNIKTNGNIKNQFYLSFDWYKPATRDSMTKFQNKSRRRFPTTEEFLVLKITIIKPDSTDKCIKESEF